MEIRKIIPTFIFVMNKGVEKKLYPKGKSLGTPA